MIWHWLIKFATWACAGFLAGKFMKKGEPSGILSNIVIGAVGGLVGSVVFGIIGLNASNRIGDLAVSLVGSCLLIWLVRRFDLTRFLH